MKYSETKLSEMAESSAIPFALLSHDGSLLDQNNTYGFRTFVQRRFGTFIRLINTKAGVRRRKQLDTLTQILHSRGINCLSIPDCKNESVSVKQSNCCTIIERQNGKGLFLTLESVKYRGMDVLYGATRSKEHVTASEEDVADLLEMFDHFLDLCHKVIASAENGLRQQNLLSEIQMPVIEQKVKDFMQKKSISNYNLLIDNEGKTVLEVQMTGKFWMVNNTVNLENVDRILGIIPYLLKRPDRIAEDGLGFRTVTKFIRR